MGGVLSRVAMIVFWLGILAALMTVRVVFESHTELANARSLQAEGDRAGAVDHYRRALRWYAPANPYSRQAGSELLELASEAQQADQIETARRALRSVIAGINASRSFYVPYRDLYARAQAGLDELREGGPASEREEEGTPQPAIRLSSLLVVAGFIAWVLSAFAFAQRGISSEGNIVRAEALRWLGTFLLGMLAFMLGLVLN